MKALTLYQPQATLVAIRAKQIETRSWSTTYRGPLAIHAASSTPKSNLLLANLEPYRSALAAAGYHTPYQLPAGQVLAIATLAAIYPIVDADKVLVDDAVYIIHDPERTFGNYTPGRHAWMLPYCARFETPIPARGRQRLWNWQPYRCPVCESHSVIAEIGVCQDCWEENASTLGFLPQLPISPLPNSLLPNRAHNALLHAQQQEQS